MFEWYDFFLYGSLVANINMHFYSGVNETTGYILALATFAAGFIVRPFGALAFGRIGDIVGRKNTFLVTMIIMGIATFVVGLLPGADFFEAMGPGLGVIAPILLVALRVLQGLAIGGEYGGAATYIAEHAPANRRGFFTSWIQITATIGLFISLLVILGVRSVMSPEDFNEWGWRIPFLLSAVLLVVSVWIRVQLNESPVFLKMKEEAATSKAPLVGSVRQLEEREVGADRAVRLRDGPGGDLVHRHVLRPHLHEADPAHGSGAGGYAGGDRRSSSARRSTSSSAGCRTRSAAAT